MPQVQKLFERIFESLMHQAIKGSLEFSPCRRIEIRIRQEIESYYRKTISLFHTPAEKYYSP